MTKEERDTVSQGLEWDDWARILGRDPATLDVDEIITADNGNGRAPSQAGEGARC
jgi:hypothetical protein